MELRRSGDGFLVRQHWKLYTSLWMLQGSMMTENGGRGDVEEDKVDVHMFVECTNRRNWNPICSGHHPPDMWSPISVVPRRL